MKMALGVLVLALVVLLGGSPAWGGEGVPLNDVALDAVYGGEPSDDGNGGLIFTNVCESCTLNISGTQNANSAILVNAVGSTVSAQLNIAVYNGSGGSVSQMDVGFTSAGNISN